MSYDVSIKAKLEGVDRYIELSHDSCNITWNVRELIRQSSGWDIINEDSNGPVRPWLEKIQTGLINIGANPKKYKKYESPNEWGTIYGVKSFYIKCINMANSFLEEYPELAEIAVVWVE